MRTVWWFGAQMTGGPLLQATIVTALIGKSHPYLSGVPVASLTVFNYYLVWTGSLHSGSTHVAGSG